MDLDNAFRAILFTLFAIALLTAFGLVVALSLRKEFTDEDGEAIKFRNVFLIVTVTTAVTILIDLSLARVLGITGVGRPICLGVTFCAVGSITSAICTPMSFTRALSMFFKFMVFVTIPLLILFLFQDQFYALKEWITGTPRQP